MPEELTTNEINNKQISGVAQDFPDYNFQFYSSTEKDVLKSVNHFSLANELELIIALPGKHSFLFNLAHRNIIKCLAKITISLC